jgi:predicted nucleic acid-binding protein
MSSRGRWTRWALRLSERERPSRAVLDSDVIFSRVLYELLGRIAADERLLTLVWSEELLAEAQRVLAARKPMPAAAAERWVGHLREAFPGERVALAGLRPDVDLAAMTEDVDDQHVCALAVIGSVDLLVTFDRGYLRAPLAAHGVEVVEPDALLVSLLDEHPAAVLASLESQAHAWAGGRPMSELVDALARARAPRFAAGVRAALSLPG